MAGFAAGCEHHLMGRRDANFYAVVDGMRAGVAVFVETGSGGLANEIRVVSGQDGRRRQRRF